MEKIESFKINHKLLIPGIYVSRIDKVEDCAYATTFDIRVKRPNFEDCMSPAAAHTIEHIGATFFRNDIRIKNRVIYFGPMGCLTGFYLVIAGKIEPMTPEFFIITNIIKDMFREVNNWNGNIPGATPTECGNFRMNDLYEAKNICANMLVLMEDLQVLAYEYPNSTNSAGIETSISVNSDVLPKLNIPEVKLDYDKDGSIKALDDLEEKKQQEKSAKQTAEKKITVNVEKLSVQEKKVKKTVHHKKLNVDITSHNSIAIDSSLNPESIKEVKQKIKETKLEQQALF